MGSEAPGGDTKAYVNVDGRLAQFISAPVREDSDEPNAAYWEENWHGIGDAELRHALRRTRSLGTQGRFFRRHLKSRARILEGGCGTGLWMRRLGENGYSVVGLDYAAASLKRSKAIAPDMKLSAGDLLGLPFADATFDAYMSFGVIEHFVDGPARILSEACRVLRPGGVALVSTPFLNRARRSLRGLTREEAESRGLQFHQYFFTLDELHADLRRAGLEPLPDRLPYSVWHGLDDVAPIWRRRISAIPLSKLLAYGADYLPGLGSYAAHMIFAVARKPL